MTLPILFLLLILLALAGVLLYFYWLPLLIAGFIGLLLYALYRYFWRCYGCIRCGGAGVVQGDDPVLHVHYTTEEPCYMCGGKGIPPKNRWLWHRIAKKAMQKWRALLVREALLERRIEQFRRAMKFSAKSEEAIVFAHNKVLAKTYQHLAALETEIEAYTLVQKQAFVNAHNIHLMQVMDDARGGVEQWDRESADGLNDSVYFVKDAAFLQQHDFLPLLHQQDQDYLELISTHLRRDIEEAVEEFKLLIHLNQKS